jgi:hypothetical protein
MNAAPQIKLQEFHLPQKPYSVIDAINRHAAGQGTVGYAMAASDADYNGHAIIMTWNAYRRYYVCEHHWGERVVHARGTAEQVLPVAVREYQQQGRGASLFVGLKPEDAHLAAQYNLLPGREASPQPWRTPLHAELLGAAMYERNGLCPAFSFLASSRTAEEYKLKIEAFFASHRRAVAA